MAAWYRPDGTLTALNRAAAEFVGRPREELVGTRWHEHLRGDMGPLFEELARLTPDRPTLVHDHWVDRAEGTARWMRWTNTAIFDEQGRWILVVALGHDLTEAREREEALRAALRDRAGKPATHDPAGVAGLTSTAAHFMAGILAHMPALCAIACWPA